MGSVANIYGNMAEWLSLRYVAVRSLAPRCAEVQSAARKLELEGYGDAENCPPLPSGRSFDHHHHHDWLAASQSNSRTLRGTVRSSTHRASTSPWLHGRKN